MTEPKTIAIDGPVASGKTVVGQMVAEQLDFRFLDTGIMYRAITRLAIDKRIALTDEMSLTILARDVTMEIVPGHGGDHIFLVDGEDISDQLRDTEVDQGVSLVSKMSGVRSVMVKQQRVIADGSQIVMVGRDIGTVVLPDAALKIYLTASVEIRARRRFLDFQRQGELVDYSQVVDELTRRDKIDSERADSPLRPASDATVINVDDIRVEELAEKILNIIRRD